MRIGVVAGAMLVGLGLCVGSAGAQTDLSAVRKVKNYYSEWLSTIPGVTAVDVGASQNGQPEIEIHAVHITDQIKQLPGTLNGFPVVVVRDSTNPDEGSLGLANLGAQTWGTNAPAAQSLGQSATINVNNPPVDQTDRTTSVAPAPQGAWTGPAVPTAPTANDPLAIPQEGVPPQPEGVPPPALR